MATLDPKDPQRRTLSQAVNPQGYRGIFKQASENLGQPGEKQAGFENFVVSGTGELADAYVDRYYERTGKLPSASDVQAFVANNLTPGYVQKYMTGTLGDRASVKARLVDPYLDYSDTPATPDATPTTTPGTPNTPDTLSSRLDKIYGGIRDVESQNIRDSFAPSRKRAIEEEAASGRLRSGVSYGRDSAISGVDVNEGKALSNLISQLSQSRASGELEAAKGDQAVLAQDKDLAARLREFNKTLGMDRQRFLAAQEQADTENAYNNRALSLSAKIGQMMGKKSKNPFGTAVAGAGAGATAGSAFGPWGGLIGAGLGGLAGGLGSAYGD